MPKYTYACPSCQATEQKFASLGDKTQECPFCHSTMYRQMPKIKSPKVTEVVDKYSNKKHVEDQEAVLKERKLDYYWSVEVPKMVDSGIYALDTMLEKGWVEFNEKGELVTITKPPGKR